MVVNDLLPQAAEPLFLLDYFATGRLEPGVPEAVVKGVAEGCRLAGCALLGGETAEMPDSYPAGEYDLAGFAVGLVDRPRLPDPQRVEAGQVLLGLASSGLHSNGYSLVRRVLLDRMGLDLREPVEALGARSLGEVLLEPTRIYVRSVLRSFREHDVRGAAHITGGGIPGNLPRTLPEGVAGRIDPSTWTLPGLFALMQRDGGIEDAEMYRTFNMGVGMIAAVAPGDVDAALAAMPGSWRIGDVVAREDGPPVRGIPLAD